MWIQRDIVQKTERVLFSIAGFLSGVKHGWVGNDLKPNSCRVTYYCVEVEVFIIVGSC